jgi:hypothetical protein
MPPRLHLLEPRETPALYGPAQTFTDLGPAIGVVSPDRAIDIATADFNRDGHPDLISARGTGSATVFLNDGAGGFRARSLLPGGDGRSTFGATIRIGDFNGDGNPDVALLSGRGDASTIQLWVYRGDGTGGFDAGTQFGETGEILNPVAVADLNGDGVDDLVTGSFDSMAGGETGLAVYHGRRGELFGPRTVYRVDPTGRGEVRSAAVADFDQDGKLDVAALATGSGGGRLYGDGQADLVTGSGEGEPSRVRVFLSTNLLTSATSSPDQELDPFGTVLPNGVFVG